MNVEFTARQVTWKPDVRELIEKKLGKLEKVLPRDAQAHVVLRAEKKSVSIEISVAGRQKTWTAKESGESQEAAAHAALDNIAAQAKRTKGRVKEEKKHRVSAVKSPASWPAAEADETPEHEPEAKREVVSIRAMFEEDALTSFAGGDKEVMVFRDPTTDALRVLYRRGDGRIGLVVPR